MAFRCKLADGSGFIELNRITQDVDRHGNVRLYVRMPGKPKVRLLEPIGTEAFLAEYRRAVAGTVPAKDPKKRLAHVGDATLAWLIREYYTSAEFKALTPRTQRVRRLILQRVIDRDGEKPFALLEPRHLRKRRDEISETPEAANGMLKAMRQVYRFGIDFDHVKDNPAAKVPYLERTGDGFYAWSEEDIEKFEARHPIGTMPRLALALMLYLSQRRSDAVLFGPAHVSGGWIRFAQQKNIRRKKIELGLPIVPELQAIIDATPTSGPTFLVTEFGKPFTANGFGNWFRKRCDDAGLPYCTAHGLRKAGARRLGEAGKSELEIRAVTGHTTSRQVDVYTKSTRQEILAAQALGVQIVPPSARRAPSGTKTARNRLKTKESKKGMVPGTGIEPVTRGFSIRCSTN